MGERDSARRNRLDWLKFSPENRDMFNALVVAALLLGATIATGCRMARMLRWPTAEAEMMRYGVSVSEPGGQRFHHPVYRYRTRDGRTLEGTSPWGSWRRPWPEGTRIKIRYSPQDAERSEVCCWVSDWGLSLTLLGLALGWWLLSYLVP